MTRNALTSALLALAVSAAAIASPGFARADEADDVQASAESNSGPLNDRFMFSLGTFMLSTNTKVQVNGTGGTGTDVDFDKDLGLKDADRFRVDGTWRFFKRHKLRAMYFSTSQSRTHSLDRDITIGDTTYPIAGSITAKNDTTIVELAYEYVFMKRPTFELAGSAGIHSIKFDFSVTGDATVNGVPTTGRVEKRNTSAPLPVFGFRALWEFAPKWYLDGQEQFFVISYGDYQGHVNDFRAGVVRMFGDHFGVGAGYNGFKTRLDVNKTNFDGSLKWRYGGAQIYVTANF